MSPQVPAKKPQGQFAGPVLAQVATRKATPISPTKTALVFAALLGLWHFAWALLVAVGFAQPVMDFVFWMHFLTPPWHVEPFRAGIAAILVVVTCVIGYATGYVAALFWNWLHD